MEWTPQQMTDGANAKFSEEPELNQEESALIRCPELCQKYLAKVGKGLGEEKKRSPAFCKTAKLLAGGILKYEKRIII